MLVALLVGSAAHGLPNQNLQPKLLNNLGGEGVQNDTSALVESTLTPADNQLRIFAYSQP